VFFFFTSIKLISRISTIILNKAKPLTNNVLMIYFVLKVYDTFSLYLKYCSLHRLQNQPSAYSRQIKRKMVSIPNFFLSICETSFQASYNGKFFVILHLNGSPKSIHNGYLWLTVFFRVPIITISSIKQVTRIMGFA